MSYRKRLLIRKTYLINELLSPLIDQNCLSSKLLLKSSKRNARSYFFWSVEDVNPRCVIICMLPYICNTWYEKKTRKNVEIVKGLPSGNNVPALKLEIIFSSRGILSLSLLWLRFSHARRPSISTVSQLIIRIKRNRDGSYPRLLKGSRGRIITESPRFGKACMRFLELRTRMQEMVHGEKGLRDGNNDGRMSRLSRYSPTSAFESFLKISVKK